jgi:hypothetical protein
MTGTDVVVHQPQQLTVLSNDQLTYISRTEFVPPGLRGNLPAILACVATGRALGIADMTALRSIHIIDGKATFAAELMVLLVRRAGHSITGEVADGSATVTGTRADNGDTLTSTWTLAMADRAGLLNKSNWKKYPESMLWARAVSQLCRMLFADCFAGNTYTPEELDAEAAAAQHDLPADGEDDGLFPPLDAEAGPPAAEAATAAQLKKLNVLVGTLREAEQITTEFVWEIAGREPVPSEDGELHWSPLRDTLTKAEAHALIEQLEALEPGLSLDALRAWINTESVDTTRLTEIAKDIAPAAKSYGALTDRQRAQVQARYLELTHA